MVQKRLFLFLGTMLFIYVSGNAQHYGTATGVRLANSDLSRTVGLTLQQRVANKLTVEGILQSDFNLNTTLSVLVQQHRSLLSQRFNYYSGAGLAFGKEESLVKNTATKEIIHTYGNATTGIDLIAGIEMKLANAVISLDYKPNINLSGREEFFRGQVGISARTVLVKSSEQKRNQRQRQKSRHGLDNSLLKPFSKLLRK
jgi:hypothetical protein